MMCGSGSCVSRVLAVLAFQALALACGPARCPAAFEGCLVDSRAEALGDCWCVSDFSALSMAPLPPPETKFALGLSFRRPFGLADLEEKEVAVNVPFSRCVGSLGFMQRGGGLYRERALSATASMVVRTGKPGGQRPAAQRAVPAATRGRPRQAGSPASVSVSLTLFETSVEGWGATGCLSVSAGARASPVSFADVCVGLGNVVSNEAGLGLRRTFLVGVAARPHTAVTFAAEVRREPGENSSFHAGAELQPCRGVCLRCGLRTEPLELTMGLGVSLRGIGLDTASSVHTVLGRTDAFSLRFSGSGREADENVGR